jgi:glycosyltransferase involved in cell wall biosynthesis
LEQKSITFLINSYFKYLSGGAEYQAYLLAQEFVKKKFKVSYIFRNISNISNIPKVDNGIFLYPINNYEINKNYLYKRDIKKILDELNPHYIYHRNLNYFLSIANSYSKTKFCKTIWHISADKELYPWKIKFKKNILKSYYLNKLLIDKGIKNADYIIAQTETQSISLQNKYNIAPNLIVKNFHPLPVNSIIKSEKIKVIWIANFKEWKQPDLFIDLSEKFSSNKNIIFQMAGRIGSNIFGDSIKKRIKDSKNLIYLGELTIKEVNQYMEDADIFVNTSLPDEGFPNSFIQAWMRKVPVISLNFDPDNIIKKYKLGFHSKSFKQMIDDINLLLQDLELRQEFSRNAYNYAIKNHSMSNIQPIISMVE